MLNLPKFLIKLKSHSTFNILLKTNFIFNHLFTKVSYFLIHIFISFIIILEQFFPKHHFISKITLLQILKYYTIILNLTFFN